MSPKKIISDYKNGFIVMGEMYSLLFKCALENKPSDIISIIPEIWLEEFNTYVHNMINSGYNSWFTIHGGMFGLKFRDEEEIKKEEDKRLYHKWYNWMVENIRAAEKNFFPRS